MRQRDLALELVAQVAPEWVEAGRRQGVPLGFTWALLVPADQGHFDQPARERANGKAMEEILQGIEDAEYTTVEGYLAVRVLDERGQVTEAGKEAAEVMAALEDHPIIDEDTMSEIEQLGVEYEVDEIENELENGYLWVWTGRKNVQLDLGDGPTDKQKAKLWERYSGAETETPYDDRGYGGIDRRLLAGILHDMGLVMDEED